MEKAIQFTEEQKSLIWRTKVQPKKGTADDALMFMEVCEQYGLNPLLNDIVFNRYETKSGPVVNFIVTRDAYLKVAMRDQNYVKVIGNVVKEGDHFQMNTVDGSIEHRFGTKRGNILGAWAIAEHKTRGRLPVFVDFEENWKANAASQNGRNAVWDDRPSAMILKVAEVTALRRQFPLGGVVAAEEIGLNDLPIVEMDEPSTQPQKEPVKEENKTPKKNTQKSSSETQEKKVKTEQPKKQEEEKEVKEKTQSKPVDNNPVKKEEKSEATKQVEPENEETTETELVTDEPTTEQEPNDYTALSVLDIKMAKSPASGQIVAKVAVEAEDGSRFIILTNQEEVILKLDEVETSIENPQTYLLKYITENGYNYLLDVGGKAV
ncbi:RecT family recombinase [Robertmurraya massiliosenegalensis]|uniref:RecT family recombinase n=1 Tax=Robertmurraya massiliosenegalensis TaxID=1287657 RepID=UPI0002EE94E4|nr:RecT family recombinase [Robertmurraya massiliosenegalensis]